MAQGEWTEPGQGELSEGRRLRIAMYRPPNNRVAQVFLYPQQDGLNDDDWQALLDGLAAIPGMAEAQLVEGSSVSRARTPDRSYEPLPPVNDA
ncbi:hypothetical protein SEA_MICRODON_35 [Streptomyces phage Microdon]|nr:hypothetical protein SEA_MICRODON_35 [Streptomyces phage Microdon]